MALLLETEKEKVIVLQVPRLSKPSIYHQVRKYSTDQHEYVSKNTHTHTHTHTQSAVQISQPVLTEAMLKRHNQTEAPPDRPTFSGKQVTVNNR